MIFLSCSICDISTDILRCAGPVVRDSAISCIVEVSERRSFTPEICQEGAVRTWHGPTNQGSERVVYYLTCRACGSQVERIIS